MSQPQHLSADLISDLLEGSLPADEAMPANAHLAQCPECADLRDSLLDVQITLAAEGAVSWPMPADIAASLDAALVRAGLERGADVIPLDPVRRRATSTPRRWLTAAAAAVVVAGVGVAGWQLLDQDGTSSTSAGSPTSNTPNANGDTGSDTAGGSDPLFGGPNVSIPPLATADVAARALRLEEQPGRRLSPEKGGCQEPLGNEITTVVLWHGLPTVLAVSPATRTATIFDCKTGVHALYTTGY